MSIYVDPERRTRCGPLIGSLLEWGSLGGVRSTTVGAAQQSDLYDLCAYTHVAPIAGTHLAVLPPIKGKGSLSRFLCLLPF